MRALVIGEHETVATTIAEIITRNGLNYPVVDVGSFDSALAIASRSEYELTIVALPSDMEHGLVVLRGLRSAASRSTIVAIGPTDDAQFVLRVLRQGADEYLGLGELDTELPASLSRLSAKQSGSGHPGRVVGLLAASGGSGSSVLTANLAVLLASGQAPTAVIDLRAAASDLAVLLDLKPEHNLADLCRKISRLDPDMLRQSLARHASGVQLLAAPSAFDDMAHITPAAVRTVLTLARSLFPYVLLDLDRSLGSEQLAAVLQVDLLLLVLRLDIASLRNVRRILDYLRDQGVADNRIRAVANRYGQPKELPLRKVEQALGIPIAYCVSDDPAGMNRAVNAGVPVVLDRPRARVSKSLMRLADDLQTYFQERYRQNGEAGPAYAAIGAAGE
jgi:pilus assembly protein CpaE